jgi:hypothetical protein
MIGIGIGTARVIPSGGGVVVYDTSYQAILTYATSQGYTLPSLAQRTKSNQFVIDLKAAGLWTKLDSLSIFKTDGNANFALTDWKRLTTHTPVNGPVFTSNVGFTGNGSSAYINPNWNITQATQAIQNSIFHGVLTNSILPNVDTGYHGGGSSPYNIINTYSTGGSDGFYANGAAINITQRIAAFRAVSRTATNAVYTYQDDIIDNSPFTSFLSSAPSPGPIYIMARGVPTPQWHAPSNVEFKADFWGAGLTPSEVATFRTLLNNYIASL